MGMSITEQVSVFYALTSVKGRSSSHFLMKHPIYFSLQKIWELLFSRYIATMSMFGFSIVLTGWQATTAHDLPNLLFILTFLM